MNSANAKPLRGCEHYACSITAYVDGELDCDHAADMETHVLACADCTEKVAMLRALRLSLKKRAQPARCPDALRAKMATVVAREKVRAKIQEEAEQDLGPKITRLKYAVGLAAAAGVLFAMGIAKHRDHQQQAMMQTGSVTDSASLTSIDKLLDDLVALHANPVPPETMNIDDVTRWDGLVGVPVRRPALQPFGGSFHGARVYATGDRRAAMLSYTVDGGHRVTVYVFNPRNVPMQATQLEPRYVHRKPVLVGKLRGYSVAAAEQSGVGYALASDVNEDEAEQMVIAALQ